MANSRLTPEILAARAARRARTQWVEGQSYRLAISGFSSSQAAEVITKMGRGLLPGRLEGVEYPHDYSISSMAVSKAFRRFTQHNKPHSLLEMRRIDTQRCEDIFKAFLPALVKGDCRVGIVAIAALRHKARINGVEMPAKVAMTNSTSEDLVPIPLATIRKIMDGGEVVFDHEGPAATAAYVSIRKPSQS
jgi:hypothetical protein